MGKHWTKNQKTEIVKYYKINGSKKTIERYEVSRATLGRWNTEHKHNALSDSKSGRTKGHGQGRPISRHDYDAMTREQLIERLKIGDSVKKILPSLKEKKNLN